MLPLGPCGQSFDTSLFFFPKNFVQFVWQTNFSFLWIFQCFHVFWRNRCLEGFFQLWRENPSGAISASSAQKVDLPPFLICYFFIYWARGIFFYFLLFFLLAITSRGDLSLLGPKVDLPPRLKMVIASILDRTLADWRPLRLNIAERGNV